MKSFLVFVALLGAIVLSNATSPVVSNAAATSKKDRAVMRFNDPVKLLGITLQGDYLFVHDDEAMLRGESCTYVYRGVSEQANELVASFHCTPLIRAKVNSFTVRSVITGPGEVQIREFQFAGSTESHLLPVGHPGVDMARMPMH